MKIIQRYGGGGDGEGLKDEKCTKIGYPLIPTLRPTHTGRDSAMQRDFPIFKSRQICSWKNCIL